MADTALAAERRAAAHADIETRAAQFRAEMDARQYAALPSLAAAGDVEVARACEYDRYVALIMSRDTSSRRATVLRIRAFLEAKYRFAYDNEADPEFRTVMTRMFDIATSGSTRLANTIQMFIIHVAVLLESDVARSFCPPAPDPDDPGAVDTAIVDRAAFVEFEQHYLFPYFLDLRDGTTLSVLSFTNRLDKIYVGLQPTSPVDAVIANNNVRRIRFSDPEARQRLASAGV